MDPPKTRGKGYIPINFVMINRQVISNKCQIGFSDNKLYVDGSEVNSLLLEGNGYVLIKAQHFTSKQVANEVRTLRRFIAHEEDGYVYFLEDGWYGLSSNEIRHISGATSAEVKFEVKFSVPAIRVWIKVEKQHPIKFAIEAGLYPDEIIEIVLDRLPR